MIAVILLAAGAARRFGSQKLLAPMPDGRLVIECSIANLSAATSQVIAVTRNDLQLIDVLAKFGCRVVVNAHADFGMGSSIAAGVQASTNASGWLIVLGDMPLIDSKTISTVIDALIDSSDIVVPTSHGRSGHPVLFGSAYRDELLSLTGDQGARRITQNHSECLKQVPVDDAGILRDIDTTTDLMALQSG